MPPTWDRPRRTSNIAPLLSDIKARIALLLLNIPGFGRRMSGMKHTVPILAILALTLLPVPARAAGILHEPIAQHAQRIFLLDRFDRQVRRVGDMDLNAVPPVPVAAPAEAAGAW